jgi:hypothetical protein
MELVLADEGDNLELINFFKEFPLRGLVDVKIDRLGNFFAPYEIQSDIFKTYLLKDSQKNIQASASFIARDALYEGEVLRVATATDLRVKPQRKAIAEWSNHFLPVLERETRENDVSHVFSTINLSDTSILNTFVRPRTMKRAMPRYYLYRKFNLVSLHGSYPWAKPPIPSIKIRPAHPGNVDALAYYIIQRSQFRPFASIWNTDSFAAKLKRLKGMKLEDFLIAFDSNDNVVGCLSPWSPQYVQNYVPLSYSLRAHNFRQFLKFFSLFGMTRRLAKPIISTGFETPLSFKFLLNIFVDNEDIFESLVYTAFENALPSEFLLYTHCEKDYRILPPLAWVSSSLPFALYAVTPPAKEMPEFLNPAIGLNPEIEAHTVF